VRGRGAQQQRERAAVGGSERKPPHRDGIDGAVPPFADHRSRSAAAQRFLHRPQQILRARSRDRQQTLGAKPEGREPEPAWRTAFSERHILGEPGDTVSVMPGLVPGIPIRDAVPS